MIAERRETSFPALRDSRYPVSQVADTLEPYLRLIVERFHPERIILFGSYAYGTPTVHSDFDLLVVRDGIQSETQSTKEILNALWDIPGHQPPLTILSKTPARLSERLAVGSPFYQEITENGLEVYAA